MKACAIDLAAHGITVNSVSPGPIATPQTADLHGPTIRTGTRAELLAQTALFKTEDYAEALDSALARRAVVARACLRTLVTLA